ncbi:uncharacterized protein LOC117282748 isoform X4 [Cryptotermes secundus]|uniref:uncharacterized protein LOC117282748 isoform X4 n=1 Tax=Cryptotermes secundus TaxID=105785 RepID=UPI001454C06A|nr:uncharacterized protein LOC117282748 isoform X4 [Cryptotermes secundus]
MAVCVVDVGKEVRRNEFCFRILPSTYHVYTQNWSYSFSTKGTHHLMLLKKSCHLLMFRKLHSLYTDVVCNPFYIPCDHVISTL